MSPETRINYRNLRQINPEAARKAVLEYLKTKGGSKAKAARVYGTNRTAVHDILDKIGEGDLQDRLKTLKHQPNVTPPEVERKVIEARNKTRLRRQRLSIYLIKDHDLQVPPGRYDIFSGGTKTSSPNKHLATINERIASSSIGTALNLLKWCRWTSNTFAIGKS